jgi:hypothetical protein
MRGVIMKSYPVTFVAALALLLTASACEQYDPPPEVSLIYPEGGMWFRDSPLELQFSEAVVPETISFSVWPHDLDIEGRFLPGTEPIAKGCTLNGCESAQHSGEPVAVALSDDATRLTITQGGLFECREGQPFLIRVAAGLQDTAGRRRQVHTEYVFQVNPRPQGGEIDLDLNSGVLAMVADFGSLVPGIRLRLYCDIELDEANGEVVIVGTLGGLKDPELPANTVDPNHLEPRYGEDGWSVLLTGVIYEKECGEYYFETDTTDLHITVSNVFLVHLNGLGLEATIRPGEGLDGRMHFEGYMHIEEGFWGIDPADMAPLGEGGAAWEGNVLEADEVPVKLPKVCATNPCAVHEEFGGDCKLPDPWLPPASCP